MKNIRILLIGLVIGGGLGAKIGAYLSAILNDYISWSLVEWGAGIGIALGCTVSGAIILVKSGAFEPQEKKSTKTSRQIAPSSI